MPRCIYCTEIKTAADFNREHVIPESFGGFRDALVLAEMVCEACNSYFGRTLDLRLARGSDEGFQRYVWKVRDPAEIERFRYDSTVFVYDGGGDYQGCLLRLTADADAPGGFHATPIDQVGFARANGDGFEWMSLRQVQGGGWKEREDLDPTRGVKIYAQDPERVRAYLEGEGVAFPSWRPMHRDAEPDGGVTVQQISRFTDDLRRVVAKIAFNYLAFVHGADFALRPEFETIRRFIRNGEGGENLVEVDAELPIPPPPNTPPDHRPVVHVVTIEHAVNADVVLGQVSLFGGLRYQVLLSDRSVPDLLYRGHLFNVADGRAYPLGNRRQTKDL